MKYGVDCCLGDWRVTENLADYFRVADRDYRQMENRAKPITEHAIAWLVQAHYFFQDSGLVLADLHEKGIIVFESDHITLDNHFVTVRGSVARVLKEFTATDESIYAPVHFRFVPVVPAVPAMLNFDDKKIPLNCCKMVLTDIPDKLLDDEGVYSYLMKYFREQQQLYYSYQNAFGI